MRLIELEPEIRTLEGLGRCLVFLSPSLKGYSLAIPLDGPLENGARWTVTNHDDFERTTITPSINEGSGGWHGWVTNGEVTTC